MSSQTCLLSAHQRRLICAVGIVCDATLRKFLRGEPVRSGVEARIRQAAKTLKIDLDSNRANGSPLEAA